MNREVKSAIKKQDEALKQLVADGRDPKDPTNRWRVLCPIALDDSWKNPPPGMKLSPARLEWLKDQFNILDFSAWKTKAFDRRFEKLWEGLRIWY